MYVNVIGAGLAGSEAAYYLARNGINVKLYEMRPKKMTEAHKTEKFGELVYVLVGILTKYALGTELILYFTVGYICIMEISSLAENCDKLGVKMPEKLKDKLNNKEE